MAFPNAPPAFQWTNYSGPGVVTFGNAALTNTSASFSAPGVYTLELSAADGVHAVAYSAVVITVTSGINLSITAGATGVNLSWTGGTAPFVVEEANALPASSWTAVMTTSGQNVSLPVTSNMEFFRVSSQ